MNKKVLQIFLLIIVSLFITSCSKVNMEKKILVEIDTCISRSFEKEVVVSKYKVSIKDEKTESELFTKTFMEKEPVLFESELKEGNYIIDIEAFDKDNNMILKGRTKTLLKYGENKISVQLDFTEGTMKVQPEKMTKPVSLIKFTLLCFENKINKEIEISKDKETILKLKPGIYEISAKILFTDNTTYEIKNNVVQILPGKTSLFIIK